MTIGKLTFSDEFNSLSAGPSGQKWKTTFDGGVRTLRGNGELEYYVEPGFKGSAGHSLGINPFSVSNGILKISARPVDAADKPYLYGYKYTSGLLTSQDSLQQLYGYFEVRADLPSGKGMFPAFWMLAPHKWPPEADIFEQIGSRPKEISQGVFSKTGPDPYKITNTGVDMTQGFHTYGMLWDAKHVTWYIDGKQTFQVATPSDMHEKMYVLLNLAVGGNWAGTPDGTVNWSKADLLVDYVHVYALGSNPTPSPTPTTPTPQPAPQPAPSTPAELAVSQGDDKPWVDLKITGANTSTAYTIAHPTSGHANVKASFDAQKDLTLVNLDAWNAVKNAKVDHLPGKDVTIKNFVNVDITTGGAGNNVDVSHVKRGTIATGDGDDHVTIAGYSNSTNNNLTKVSAGLGADTITFTGNAAGNARLDGGDGTDRLTIGDHATGALVGGKGNDTLVDLSDGKVTLTGNSGSDTFTFGKNAQATITDFAAGADSVKLLGVAASQVHVTQSGADTVLDVGAGAVRLTGVHLSQSQLDLHFG